MAVCLSGQRRWLLRFLPVRIFSSHAPHVLKRRICTAACDRARFTARTRLADALLSLGSGVVVVAPSRLVAMPAM